MPFRFFFFTPIKFLSFRAPNAARRNSPLCAGVPKNDPSSWRQDLIIGVQKMPILLPEGDE